MLFDNRIAKWQTQTRASSAVGLRVERIEDVAQVRWSDAVPGVGHPDADLMGDRLDVHAESAPGGHGVDGVQEKVHEHLLEQVGVSLHERGRIGQLRPYGYVLNLGLVGHQRQRFFQDGKQVQLHPVAPL